MRNVALCMQLLPEMRFQTIIFTTINLLCLSQICARPEKMPFPVAAGVMPGRLYLGFTPILSPPWGSFTNIYFESGIYSALTYHSQRILAANYYIQQGN